MNVRIDHFLSWVKNRYPNSNLSELCEAKLPKGKDEVDNDILMGIFGTTYREAQTPQPSPCVVPFRNSGVVDLFDEVRFLEETSA